MQHARKLQPADVIITDELDKRTSKSIDPVYEKIALQNLAALMADHPENVLPRFVELAMTMGRGVSAGLSLLEDGPGAGVFRWHYLRGALATFEGATTPRDFSPCGVTLDQNAPVLTAHPESAYDWIAAHNLSLAEVLLVPLHRGDGEPLGTLWIVSDEDGHFNREHARVATELAAFVGIALRMLQSERLLRQSLDEQQTLVREMNHRIKNLFAMTDGMIFLSAKGAANKEELAASLSGRLHALANAHALVRRTSGDAGAVENASDLEKLIRAIVLPHEAQAGEGRSRFSIGGPSIECDERATNGVALIVHELATNAAKYGALKTLEGHVDIAWRFEKPDLIIRWTENGGPRIDSVPKVGGFGSELVRKMAKQFRGKLDYDWRPEGLGVTVSLPIHNLLT